MKYRRIIRSFITLKLNFIFFLLISLLSHSQSQNVVIVVIDGARYSETFGAQAENIPYIWNFIRPHATIYTNVYNNGDTRTISGHASIVTGTWQYLKNDGSERPMKPTLFEYFRQQTQTPESDCYVIAGADKLNSICYSEDSNFGWSFAAASITNNYTGDLETYKNLIHIMDNYSPRLILVNFKDTDRKGHTGIWEDYIASIKKVDKLIYQLWLQIQDNINYKNNTTLYITNDHGRHDNLNGGFKHHGDSCEGCRHIMLLAIGRNVPTGKIVTTKKYQIDIAPTAAHLLSITAFYADGINLDQDPVSESLINPPLRHYELQQNYPNPFNATTTIEFNLTKTSEVKLKIFNILGEEVEMLVSGTLTAGSYRYDWSRPAGMASGIYMYRLSVGSLSTKSSHSVAGEAEDFVATKKMILTR